MFFYGWKVPFIRDESKDSPNKSQLEDEALDLVVKQFKFYRKEYNRLLKPGFHFKLHKFFVIHENFKETFTKNFLNFGIMAYH